MNPELFNKIKRAFERRGGVIDQSLEAQRYLQSRNAEAATFNSKTIVLKAQPSSAEVFEELIHTAQYRSGRARGDNILEMEIEASEKLIRHRRVYRISNDDARTIIGRLRNLRGILEKGNG
jgi:uncharacterized protein (DUF1778 family)